jgi:hypothetical protein
MDDIPNEDRRLRLMTIVDRHFAGDNDAVMRAIKEVTGQERPAQASNRRGLGAV